MKNLKTFISLIFVAALIGLLKPAPLVLALAAPAVAQPGRAPAYQLPIYTPTPGPDGRIIYIVQAGDTLYRISVISGLSIEKLRELNKLSSDEIREGQQLLLGLGGPVEATITPGPSPTPTPVLPSPTPKPGAGMLCIILYNDLNGDSIRQEDEPSLEEGAISISNRSGTVSEQVATTGGLEHQCFENLPEGDFTISIAVPPGFNSTTITSYVLKLAAGDESYIDFGAQANSETLAEAPILPTEGERSPLLGILGGLILLAGVGVGLFAFRLFRK